MGDYLDGFSSSERAFLKDGRLHESSTAKIEAMQSWEIKRLAKELDFMKGKLLGLLGGNHFTHFEDGSTSDNRLCGMLGCRFLGVQTMFRLILQDGTRKGRSIAVDIAAHHGKGGGRLAGSTFNSVEQMVGYVDADIYAMGHDHKRGVIPCPPKIRLVQSGPTLALRQREPRLVRSGSFLRSYEDGQASYNVDAGRGPCSLGHVELELTIRRDQSEGGDAYRLEMRGIA